MAKKQVTIGQQRFAVANASGLHIAQRVGQHGPILSSDLLRIAFVLEGTTGEKVLRIRASNAPAESAIQSRPSTGWNQGMDWSSLLPAAQTKAIVPPASPTGAIATARSPGGSAKAAPRNPLLAQRHSPPEFRRHQQHPNVPPSDTKRKFVFRPMPRVAAF